MIELAKRVKVLMTNNFETTALEAKSYISLLHPNEASMSRCAFALAYGRPAGDARQLVRDSLLTSPKYPH
jgi:hypothetical protein